ncbi:MAG: sn-glycerol-3-phosphate ABC transporter ATP-binding protein UgpC, partial [Gemmatimonadetes bacterium]|nr:sn-glycerol-3-phosphate ABC transporter ATP-binding protein UgpC [Gemmatimonadota bacterium]NIQ55818.1 sn-glycerol-3-phosphate ABC transporter ATP-binding protein UgpC [Gemmatimonadota bacterium]NIU76024.1 sn-glycerol-3-phosphate ABC transporter ATP-binding protein UgpC [Gammaproteobacteria bacterium]NIX45596.1 sn-glycerol-3-phosphate ABC transporter ATP-binding protein UgpC [Gemmatimonadota bacterium]NIY09885.1 sn-glycerol-3-phosphate ABC transporter ATP-binding protein UgpC [Gemmatimonadot
RPENVLGPRARPPGAPLSDVHVTIEALEPLGNEVFIHATAAGHRLTARVAPQPLPPAGESTDLALDLRKLHFFDGETEQAIPGDAP